MVKKYNRGRKQKRNLNRHKLKRNSEEIARELGVKSPGGDLKTAESALREKRKTTTDRERNPAFDFDGNGPLV